MCLSFSQLPICVTGCLGILMNTGHGEGDYGTSVRGGEKKD